jgi:hypothetical protein
MVVLRDDWDVLRLRWALSETRLVLMMDAMGSSSLGMNNGQPFDDPKPPERQKALSLAIH